MCDARLASEEHVHICTQYAINMHTHALAKGACVYVDAPTAPLPAVYAECMHAAYFPTLLHIMH
jgi:hypothetical protein